MLKSLFIQNYALIQSVKLDFSEGLNVIIGETGAGKSIMLGALQLILGKRADSKVLFQSDKKCIVEGVFSIENAAVRSAVKKHELDDDDEELILRREISTKGKSRAFINDTPVTLTVLSEITANLIDLHQQFDYLEIHQSDFQLMIVDTLADNDTNLEKYQSDFKTYKAKRKQKVSLEEELKAALSEQDFMTFQLNELAEANLEEGEKEKLESELNRLNHAEGIKTSMASLTQILDGPEPSFLDQIRSTQREIEQYSQAGKEVNAVSERLISVIEELSDLSNTASGLAEDTEHDPATIEQTGERLDLIYKLEQKHRVESTQALLDIQASLSSKLGINSDRENELAELESDIKLLGDSLNKQAEKIKSRRAKAIPKIEKEIVKVLGNMAMPNARIEVRQTALEELTNNGIDKIEFYFSANKGFDFIPLNKAASGGEISRLNLSIKSVIAGKRDLPTLVFDEIDAGISGEVARKMGNLLTTMSSDHQLISITHSPQIAARGRTHFFVYKKEENNQMQTAIKCLTADEKIIEIAKMLSGDPPPASALENAKALIENPA